jgi:hypothetical protein
VVDALSSALDRGGHGLSNAPALLRRVLTEESWREFETQRGEVVRHERFVEFVTTPPLKGLGTTLDLIQRIVSGDADLVDLLDRELAGRSGTRTDLVDNINEVGRPDGTSRQQALRRLRKDAPELHADVLAGRLSAHAAMVQAGLRSRTISVPSDRPDRAAAALRRNMSPEDLAELRRLLDQE